MTDRKPIAVYCMSNWGGVEILSINYGIDDSVDWRYYNKEEGTSKLEYDIDDNCRTYFMIGELKIYLDECMRTEVA